MKYDFLVIGAGISGLSSALLLARFGYKVAILEQAARPAPLISGFVRSGVYFETGFHYAGGGNTNGPLDCNLKALGVAKHLEKTLLNRDAFDCVNFADSGFRFDFPQGYDLLENKLVTYFPEQQEAIHSYLDKVRKTAANLPYYEPDGPDHFPNLATLHGETLAQVMDGLRIRGALRTLLEIHCLLHGAGPDEVPFLVHAGVVDGYYRSAHTFKGGGRSLARAFSETAKTLGIEIFCRTQVEKITLSAAGSITGAMSRNGDFFSASNCILTAHPACLLKLLPSSSWRPAFRRRLAGLEETISADMVFLSTPAAEKFFGSNFYFIPSATHRLLETSHLIRERLLYLNFAEANGQAAGITAILPSRHYDPEQKAFSSPEYEYGKQRLGDEVRKRIINLLPDLKSELNVETVSTAKTLQAINASPGGSMYGIKHKLDQFNPGSLTRVRGLYLAGQGIVAPGLLGATISAFLTVGEIVGHQRLKQFRRERLCDA